MTPGCARDGRSRVPPPIAIDDRVTLHRLTWVNALLGELRYNRLVVKIVDKDGVIRIRVVHGSAC